MASGALARCVVVIALAATVPACNELVRSLDRKQSDEHTMRTRGWVEPDKQPVELHYCYATIAAVDCRPNPNPLEASRREGSPNLGEPR